MKPERMRIIAVIVLLVAGPVWGEDSDTTLEDGPVGLEEEGVDCDGLREKVDIFITLQKAVNQDFATVTDPALCHVMTEQCEHFYRAAKNLQKEYRNECDRDYEIIEVAECDYVANPCHRVPASLNVARTSVRGRARADTLSSVSGVYDVVTLSQ